MALSLKELKEYLMTKKGYTITPNHRQLQDLKLLVDNMMAIRSGSPPSTGSGYNSGVNCDAHVNVSNYKLSLGDINHLDIKGCSCHTVDDIVCYCNGRTKSCSCNDYVPICICNDRTQQTCDCRDREMAYGASHCTGLDNGYCGIDTNVCEIVNDSCGIHTSPKCSCQLRTSGTESINYWCDCYSRYGGCDCEARGACDCEDRTSACGSRDYIGCTCDNRCKCDAEKRFA